MNAILYLLIWTLAAAIPLTDSDIWWHLASAREMIAQQQFLVEDPFTFTAVGQSWNNVHWLYQLGIYGVQHLFGNAGLVAVHALLWGLAAWVWSRGKSSVSLLLLGVFCVIGMRYLLLARPIVVTLLLLGLQIRVWESKWKDSRKLLVLCVLQIALANVQGLFLLGPFFLFAWMWFSGTALSKSLGWAAILVVVSAVHPHGLSQLLYPWELLLRQLPGNRFAVGISENISPLRTLWEGGGILAWEQMFPLVAVTLFWSFACLKNRKLLMLAPIVVLAWFAERNLPLVVMVLLPLVIPDFSLRLPKLQRMLALAACLGFVFAQVQWWRELPGPVSPLRFPEGATAWLQTKLPENTRVKVFCESRHGGYLSWKLFPRVQTFVDGRFILRNASFLEQYQELQRSPQGFERLDRLYEMDWVILPKQYPNTFQNLAIYLGKHPSWRQEYQDQNTLVFRKL